MLNPSLLQLVTPPPRLEAGVAEGHSLWRLRLWTERGLGSARSAAERFEALLANEAGDLRAWLALQALAGRFYRAERLGTAEERVERFREIEKQAGAEIEALRREGIEAPVGLTLLLALDSVVVLAISAAFLLGSESALPMDPTLLAAEATFEKYRREAELSERFGRQVAWEASELCGSLAARATGMLRFAKGTNYWRLEATTLRDPELALAAGRFESLVKRFGGDIAAGRPSPIAADNFYLYAACYWANESSISAGAVADAIVSSRVGDYSVWTRPEAAEILDLLKNPRGFRPRLPWGYEE